MPANFAEKATKMWSFRQILLSGLLAAVVAAIILTCSIFRVTTTIMETASTVAQTYEVIGSIKKLQLDLVDIESGERGYVITGDKNYLFTYNTAIQKIENRIDAIAALTAGNPEQRARISNIERLVPAKLKTIKIIVDTRTAGAIDAALLLVSMEQDKMEMNRIRAVLDQMATAENTFLTEQIEAPIMLIAISGGASAHWCQPCLPARSGNIGNCAESCASRTTPSSASCIWRSMMR